MTATGKRQLSVRLSVLIAAIATVFLLIGGAAEAEGPPPPTIEYVVGAGDTLWSIAGEFVAPGADIRELISDIRDASGMSTSVIIPGQVLQIPKA